MKNEWLEETMKNLKVGDLVAKNFGSFKKSMAYVVTEITKDGIDLGNGIEYRFFNATNK